jgi:CobQ-like glutamine amidotransferase family enzyme
VLLCQHRYREAVAESLSGYQILQKKTASTVRYIQEVRQDLTAKYDALHEPVLAIKYRRGSATAARSVSANANKSN